MEIPSNSGLSASNPGFADSGADAAAILDACSKSFAMIQFEPDGTILDANALFLGLMGYGLDEIRGRHHRIFVGVQERETSAYRATWQALARGEAQSGEFKRFGAGGREVWIQGAYNPVRDEAGRVVKVVKIAQDVTEQKQHNADFAGQIAAIGKSTAVISFAMDGTILDANDLFLGLLGYRLDEVRGKHHRIFVDPVEREGAAYRVFWEQLRAGEFQQAEYRRVAKGGNEVWIQASYNPILDLSGKPFKVVKFATDVTRQARVRQQIAEIVKSLGGAAEELLQYSERMSANATETVAQASTVSAAAEEVSRSVQTVAAGTTQMGASIREIASNAHSSADVASKAVEVAGRTTATMQQLSESSNEIGKVIKVITTIAQQTKLLALNATIEAARAGASGKGFAVVANEVKELAKETAAATDEVEKKIEAIQNDARRAVSAIDEITRIIGEINHISASIATAVEEQTATTNSSNRNITEAATGTTEIARNITGVADAARSTAEGAEGTARAASGVERLARDLERIAAL